MAKVTTRTGDAGYTGLLGKERVPKYAPQPEALGAVDEATSTLGLARASTDNQRVREIVAAVQHELYLLMADLATTETSESKVGPYISEEHVARVEETMESLKKAGASSILVLPIEKMML